MGLLGGVCPWLKVAAASGPALLRHCRAEPCLVRSLSCGVHGCSDKGKISSMLFFGKKNKFLNMFFKFYGVCFCYYYTGEVRFCAVLWILSSA